MRKVILSMMVSIDGFIEGSDPQDEWFNWDEEMAKYMSDFFKGVDTFLYGRRAYEVMLSYWPSQTGEFADTMNNMPKIIFSRTLSNVKWNSRLIKENIKEEMLKIKEQPGKDLALFGGANLASSFNELDLIDEYRLIINPVLLGSGKPLFENIRQKQYFRLFKTDSFTGGNVILYYKPDRLRN